MKKLTAQVISLIFHPVILALFAPLLIIRHMTDNLMYGFEWVGFSSLFLFAIFCVLYLIRREKLFSDFDFYHKESRPVFYAVCISCAVVYFLAAFIIKGIFFPLSIASLGIIVGLVCIDIMTLYIKVSVHTAVASAFVITVGLLYGFLPFVWVMWIPFAIAWSRRFLKQHSLREVIVGGAFGLSMTLLIFYLAKVIL